MILAPEKTCLTSTPEASLRRVETAVTSNHMNFDVTSHVFAIYKYQSMFCCFSLVKLRHLALLTAKRARFLPLGAVAVYSEVE